MVFSWTVMTLLLVMSVSAYPILRQRYHNYFEIAHRFAGWTAVALVWGFVVSLTNDIHNFENHAESKHISLGRAVIGAPCIWFLVIITIAIIYPWLHLRKLQV